MSKNQRGFSRLSPLFDARQRAVLRQLLLIRQIAVCALYAYRYRHGVGSGGWPVALWSAPCLEHEPAVTETLACLRVRQFLQRGAHLGARMSRALCHRPRSGRVEDQVLLGIDSPGIDISLIHRCIIALKQRPWVFVPARDGGFVLCAANLNRRPECVPTPAPVALGMRRWGHSKVLDNICRRLKPAEFCCTEALDDIDTAQDYQRAQADGSLARALYLATRILNGTGSQQPAGELLAGLVRENIDVLGRDEAYLRLGGQIGRLTDTRLARTLAQLVEGH